MRKYLLMILSLMAMADVSAQSIKVYEYDENGELCKDPVFTTNKKVKIVVEKETIVEYAAQELEPGTRIEGKVIVDGDTITKGTGGTVPEYVDLGMRDAFGKKILWATHNLGASTPEEMGSYIAYGELGDAESGYVNGIKDPISAYSSASTKYVNPVSGKVTKYCDATQAGHEAFMDSKSELEASDDVVAVTLGGTWRMPNYAEIKCLANTKYYGWEFVGNGYKVTSKMTGYEGNSIFLPLTGYIDGKETVSEGVVAYYMSSTIGEGKEICLRLDNTNTRKPIWYTTLERYCGVAIRPVKIE